MKQKVNIIGRLTRDAAVRKSGERKFISLTVACNGRSSEEVHFYNVLWFINSNHDTIVGNLPKGKAVDIEGDASWKETSQPVEISKVIVVDDKKRRVKFTENVTIEELTIIARDVTFLPDGKGRTSTTVVEDGDEVEEAEVVDDADDFEEDDDTADDSEFSDKPF